MLACVGTQCVPSVATRVVRGGQDPQTHFFWYRSTLRTVALYRLDRIKAVHNLQSAVLCSKVCVRGNKRKYMENNGWYTRQASSSTAVSRLRQDTAKKQDTWR